MNIESFFTVQNQQAGQQSGSAGIPGDIGAQPGQAGLNFMEFFLARLLESAESNQEKQAVFATPPDSDALQSDNPLLAKNPKLDMAEILAENPEIAEEIKAYALDPQSEISETLALNLKALDDILKPLIGEQALTTDKITVDGAETPGNLESLMLLNAEDIDLAAIEGQSDIETAISGENDPLASVLKRLEHVLAKINRLMNAENPRRAILANYTPEEFAHTQNKIKELIGRIRHYLSEQDNGRPDAPVAEALKRDIRDIEQIAIGLIQIQPADAKAAVAVKAQVVAQTPATAGAPESPTDDLAARLNKLTPGSNRQDIFDSMAEDGDFDTETLKQGVKKDATGKEINLKAANTNTNSPGVKPDASLLQNWPLSQFGALLAGFDSTGGQLDPLAAQNAGQPLTSIGNMTNLATQSPSAAQPHPGTQMVAASLQKAGKGGENRILILQLDPPELGRVEVKMDFGKDKSLKATVLTEKPETYLMLQRDAQVLERALLDAGLDADGSSLSFELAEDGHDFSHNGGHDGTGGENSGGGDDGEEDLIQSTMTWHIDPETGHMRYDILA